MCARNRLFSRPPPGGFTKWSIALAVAAYACAAPILGLADEKTHAPAALNAVDLIMTNGHIKTASGWSQAMAIRKGIIVAVGRAADITALRGKDTQLLDL